MKNHRTRLAAVSLMAALGLAGCWDDDDSDTGPTASTEVPDSAGASTASFVSFLLGLNASDETSEPLTLKDTFTVPNNDTDESTPLV